MSPQAERPASTNDATAGRPVARVTAVQTRGATDQVQANRLIVTPQYYAATTPFLLLSEDTFAAPGGFESHPHRGMQTVTVVLDGALEHRDHTGAHSVLAAGDIQWMTAGRGVMHSEMPAEGSTAHTLQLWLNLPARLKMIPARYVDQRRHDVPVHREPGITAHVYAGHLGTASHPHGSDWPMMLIDIQLQAGRALAIPVPPVWRAFVTTLEGHGYAGTAAIDRDRVAWVDPAAAQEPSHVDLIAGGALRVLVFGAPPIAEPVAFGGPFVMNTDEELRQAFSDLRAGRLIG